MAMPPPRGPGPPLGGIGGPPGPLFSSLIWGGGTLFGILRSRDDLEFSSFGLFGLTFLRLGILYFSLGSSILAGFSFSTFLDFLVFRTSSRIWGGGGGVLPDLHDIKKIGQKKSYKKGLHFLDKI